MVTPFSFSAAPDQAMSRARVAAVDRDQWLLLAGDSLFRARLSGRLLYHARQVEARPCVGDWVWQHRAPADEFALIHEVEVRHSLLRRRAAGEACAPQIIAANLDCVMIVQSCLFDFNVKRLERYLAMAAESGAEARILLTKTDLVDATTREACLSGIRSAGIEVPILMLSNFTREGLAELQAMLEPGRTYCFVGSSGVGKSSLINHLSGRKTQATRIVSGTGEGRHTTVRRELICLGGGAWVIDTPGMREFGILGDGSGLEESHADIASLAPLCRFRNCSHQDEPGCAVRAALEAGEISHAHHDNYVKLKSEAAFYAMSQQERRRKDRDFGKLVRSVKRELNDKKGSGRSR